MMLAAFALAAALSAQSAPEESGRVAVSEVVGLTVGEVVARLGMTSEPAAALTIVEGDRRTEFYPIHQVTTSGSPAVICRARVLSSGVVEEARARSLPLAMVDQPPEYRRVNSVYLATRDGVVVAVINPLIRTMPARRSDERRDDHFWRRITTNWDPWVSVKPGRLPLSDASAFLDRRTDLRPPDDAVLVSECLGAVTLSPTAVRRPADRTILPSDDVGVFQGLALLPFAGRQPSLNAERRLARVQGPALLATLTPGEQLPGGLADFLRTNPSVLRYADKEDARYAVLAINLGDEPSNNLSRMNDAALLGVRDDRIIWIAPDAATLEIASALCIDDEGRTSRQASRVHRRRLFQPMSLAAISARRASAPARAGPALPRSGSRPRR